MRSILTPSSIYKNRSKLMERLLNVRGDLNRIKETTKIIHKIRSKNIDIDFIDKEELKEKLKPGFFKLMKLWKKRASTLLVYRSQIAGLMEQLCSPYCEFCGENWGLKCESINNIEEVFHHFLETSRHQGKKYDISQWNSEEWQEFFLKSVVLRTSCYSCYDRIQPKPVSVLDMNY